MIYCVYSAPIRGVGLAYWACDDAKAVDAKWFYNWNYKHPVRQYIYIHICLCRYMYTY